MMMDYIDESYPLAPPEADKEQEPGAEAPAEQDCASESMTPGQ